MPQSTTIGGRPGEPAPDRPVPRIDRLGVLRFGGQWLSLSPTHEAIMRSLIDHFGEAVTRAELAEAAWPSGGPDHHAIDVHVHRLRPRLREIGLVIHTIRGRGFLLETLLAA